MTDDETEGFLALCRKAARITTSGRGGDVDDVTQELFLWTMKTKAITSPSYRGLLGYLIREARQYLMTVSRQRNPVGWSDLSWSTAEIRAVLRETYYDLPDQLSEALASERMPEGYRAALEAAYGRREKPPRGSSAERTTYLAVDRLQEIANYPSSGEVPPILSVSDLTEAELDRWSLAQEAEISSRSYGDAERDALIGRLAAVQI